MAIPQVDCGHSDFPAQTPRNVVERHLLPVHKLANPSPGARHSSADPLPAPISSICRLFPPSSISEKYSSTATLPCLRAATSSPAQMASECIPTSYKPKHRVAEAAYLSGTLEG